MAGYKHGNGGQGATNGGDNVSDKELIEDVDVDKDFENMIDRMGADRQKTARRRW